MGLDGDGIWRRGHSTNLVGLPTGLVASAAFNDAGVELHIAGVREANRHLFAKLDATSDHAEAARIFRDYMTVLFALDPARHAATSDGGPRRYRSSYLRLLRGWAFDANGPEGAVLKGWVESRFGLFPTFHKEPIRRFSSPAWIRYIEEKMGSRFHTNAILAQLDLLYEFAQWSLVRLYPRCRHFVLYRGICDYAEHQIVEQIDRRRAIVRLNNLVSFTADRDIASWFGDYILEATVPAGKILFRTELLPSHPLRGEGEVLAIGGDYRVTAGYF